MYQEDPSQIGAQKSEEWETLQDLAVTGAGRIPKDLAEDPAVVEHLPVLFRVARGKNLSRGELIKTGRAYSSEITGRCPRALSIPRNSKRLQRSS